MILDLYTWLFLILILTLVMIVVCLFLLGWDDRRNREEDRDGRRSASGD